MLDINDALASNAWPFEEAKKLIDRFGGKKPAKGYVLFETGYGPSGLPHIGTFGEVARTTMVRRAFEELTGWETKLFAFSDDMDGLRKVPDNLPNQAMIASNLGKPLTAIPDPYGTAESFGHNMNARLRAFLDTFGFDYEFRSATDCYKSGEFDATLLKLLVHFDDVMNIILPTLGDERRATYSPFLPVCPDTGKVLQVPVIARDVKTGTITYVNETGKEVTTPVTGGHCKMQWKADWAMRWTALDVDYEMSGKDLIPSVELSSRICQAIGGRPPEGFNYELFLDDKGQKISKSKGNGLTIDEWLRYAPAESLSLFMYQSPRKAKRLYFDVIPRNVDDYLTYLTKFQTEEPAKRLANPAWHMHEGNPPAPETSLSFSLLLNLAAACNPEDPSVLWGFIANYLPGATPETYPYLDRLVKHAVAYYHDFVKPTKKYRAPTEQERLGIIMLHEILKDMDANTNADAIQNIAFAIGNEVGFTNLRDWFKALYETLLGQEQGPRIGTFIALFGPQKTAELIRTMLAGYKAGVPDIAGSIPKTASQDSSVEQMKNLREIVQKAIAA